MKIVVLAGGLSLERDVSLSTGTQVCNALRSLGHKTVLVDLFYGVENLPEDPEILFEDMRPLPPRPVQTEVPDLQAIRASRPDSGLGSIGKNVLTLCKAADIVFMALHGAPGENGMIQAMFDMMEIRYTGAGYLASALAMDKSITKDLFLRHGIRTPRGKCFSREERSSIRFSLPCIVKPITGGSSIGITIAHTEEELEKALDTAFACDSRVLIEDFIRGRELTCAVLGGEALPVAEVIPKEGNFYDYAHKYQSGLLTELIPAPIPDAVTNEVQEMAKEVMKCLQIQVYARMDFIYDGTSLYCLEANTLPGMTPTSHVPQEARCAGIDYPSLCMKIIELSLEKYESDQR